MRFLLACSVVAALTSVTACAGKKAAPKSAQPAAVEPPTGAADESQPTNDRKPDDQDDSEATSPGADPCEGGE